MIGALLINFRFLEQKFAMKSCKLTFNCSFLHMVSLVDSDVVKVGVLQCNSQLEIWREGKSGRYGDMLIIFPIPIFIFAMWKWVWENNVGFMCVKESWHAFQSKGTLRTPRWGHTKAMWRLSLRWSQGGLTLMPLMLTKSIPK